MKQNHQPHSPTRKEMLKFVETFQRYQFKDSNIHSKCTHVCRTYCEGKLYLSTYILKLSLVLVSLGVNAAGP